MEILLVFNHQFTFVSSFFAYLFLSLSLPPLAISLNPIYPYPFHISCQTLRYTLKKWKTEYVLLYTNTHPQPQLQPNSIDTCTARFRTNSSNKLVCWWKTGEIFGRWKESAFPLVVVAFLSSTNTAREQSTFIHSVKAQRIPMAVAATAGVKSFRTAKWENTFHRVCQCNPISKLEMFWIIVLNVYIVSIQHKFVQHRSRIFVWGLVGGECASSCWFPLWKKEIREKS